LNEKPKQITLTVPSTNQKFVSTLNGTGFVDGILSSLYRTEVAHALPKLTSHDRDVNAAINIRNRGLEWLQMKCSVGVEARAGEPSMNKDSGAVSLMAAPGHGRPVEGIIGV
jgi:hypothetical protein